MIKSEEGFAPFDLSKTRKFDRKKDQAFPEYRYMCEAKAMSANPVFLFAFAHILKFVYESLVRENGKDEELR